MPKEIKLAVIGAGVFNEGYHSPALQGLKAEYPELRLRGICDVREERANYFAKRFGYEAAFTDYNKMLDADNYDAAYITVPHSVVCNMVLDIAKRNIPIFLEKPPGDNVEQTRRMAAAVKKGNLVGLNRRHMPLSRRLKEKAQSLQSISFIDCQFHRYKRAHKDFFFGTAIHAIDMMLNLGGPIKRVDTIRHHAPGYEFYQHLATFRYQSGALGLLHCAPEVGSRVERYSVHGDNQSFYLKAAYHNSDDFPGILECHAGPSLISSERMPTAYPYWEITGFSNQARLFLDHIKDGVEMHPTLTDCIPAMTIAERVNNGESFDL
ncbi:MAG: Gfo/Idh/MocA family oxidoreductase [Fibrobacterota bacterium]